MPASLPYVTTGKCRTCLEIMTAAMLSNRSLGAQVITFAVINSRTALRNRSEPNSFRPRTTSCSEMMPSTSLPLSLTTKASAFWNSRHRRAPRSWHQARCAQHLYPWRQGCVEPSCGTSCSQAKRVRDKDPPTFEGRGHKFGAPLPVPAELPRQSRCLLQRTKSKLDYVDLGRQVAGDLQPNGPLRKFRLVPYFHDLRLSNFFEKYCDYSDVMSKRFFTSAGRLSPRPAQQEFRAIW